MMRLATHRHVVIISLFAAALFGGALAGALAAAESERFKLNGGSVITGPVLKESALVVMVDIGSQVVSIPQADIVRRTTVVTEAEVRLKNHDIYRTGRLAPALTDVLVKRFGDSVVMVSNGAGMGSGFIISANGHVVTNYHVWSERPSCVSRSMHAAEKRGTANRN